MKNFLKLSSLATLVALSGNYALAETATGTASVTVSNAFTLAQTTPLTFGTIRAQVSSTDGTPNVVTMTLPANGTNPSVAETVAGTGNTTDASINIITPGTPGTFSVSAAAPNSVLTITFPASAFDLTTASGGATFSAAINDAYITSGPNANRTYNATTDPLLTDGTGAVTFNVGGTLSTQAGGFATNYRDQTYSGSYTMTVNY